MIIIATRCTTKTCPCLATVFRFPGHYVRAENYIRVCRIYFHFGKIRPATPVSSISRDASPALTGIIRTINSAIVACINNAGPGLGLVGPGSNYGVLNDFQTWVCSAAMLLGRLEVFTILVLFTPTLWRK